MRTSATLVLAAMALIACTSEPRPPPGVATAGDRHRCFWASRVNNFQAVDENTVYLRVGLHDVYEAKMFTPCRDVDWAQHIAIKSHGGDSICAGIDADIISPGFGMPPHRCQIRDIRYLTPQEVAALPPKARP